MATVGQLITVLQVNLATGQRHKAYDGFIAGHGNIGLRYAGLLELFSLFLQKGF
jgi:hypothetical protein